MRLVLQKGENILVIKGGGGKEKGSSVYSSKVCPSCAKLQYLIVSSRFKSCVE